MNPWIRYFICDTSIKQVEGLRYGRGLSHFNGDDPCFTTVSENVKVYETLEESQKDFAKIDKDVRLLMINIAFNGQGYNITDTEIQRK